MGYINITTEI